MDDLRYSPISALEYRFSASNEGQWDTLDEILKGFARQPIDQRAFDRADEVQRLLAQAGLKGRKPPDLLIAAHAEILGLEVLHYDADFDHISSVTGQPSRWIVDRGTID
jgi:predicted nucleic acid-binding protein